MTSNHSLYAAVLALPTLLLAGCSVSLPSPQSALHHDPTPHLVPQGRMKTGVTAGGDHEFFHRSERMGSLAHTLALPDGSNLTATVERSVLRFTNFDDGNPPDYRAVGYHGGLEWKRAAFSMERQERIPSAWVMGAGYGSYAGYVGYVDAHAGYFSGGRAFGITPFYGGIAGASVPVWRKTFDYVYYSDDPVTEDDRTRYRYAPALWLEGLLGAQTDFGIRESGPRLFVAVGLRHYWLLQKDDLRMDEEGIEDVYSGLEGSVKAGLSIVY